MFFQLHKQTEAHKKKIFAKGLISSVAGGQRKKVT